MAEGAPKKATVLVLTRNNARLLVNPPDIKALLQRPGVLLNPDLSAVKGIAPHFWKLVDGKIVEMTRVEKVSRLADIALVGADNRVERRRRLRIPSWLLILGVGGLGAAITWGALTWRM